MTDARPAPQPQQHRLVFVGGLHRSGTTLLADLLGQHPDVSALAGTGAPHDEGQHLQDLMPTARDIGGPGAFATAPRAHLPEADALAALDAPARLMRAWAPYWDLDRPVLLEKSPPNLLRFRFLQAAFPDAVCVAIVRHPVAVSYATAPWSDASFNELLLHWLAAHERFERDRRRLADVVLLRYEDLVRDVPGTLTILTERLGLPPFRPDIEVRTDTNDRYLRRWWHNRPVPARARIAVHALQFERRLRRLDYGYSLWDRPGA